MQVFSRALFVAFWIELAAIGLVLATFVALGSLVVLLASAPFAPLPALVSAVPDVVLLTSPVTIPLAVVLAAIRATDAAARHGAFLWSALAGRDPRPRQWPIALSALALAALQLWLGAHVLPAARYEARFVVPRLAGEPDLLARRLAQKPELLPGLCAQVGGITGDRLEDLVLVSTGDARVACTARGARLGLDGDTLRIRLEGGRQVALDRHGRPSTNLAFASFELALDAAALGGPTKQTVLDLAYYTDPELDRLPAQLDALLDHGIVPTERQIARVEAIPAARATRLVSAALPFLLALAVILAVGTHRERRRPRALALVAGAVLVLAHQALVEVNVQKAGAQVGALSIAAPALDVLVLIGLTATECRRAV
jgi:hypothetical protein